MTAPARHWTENTHAYGAFDADEDAAYGELSAGERVGPPLARSGRKVVLLSIVVLLALGSWAALSEQLTWPGWLSVQITSLIDSMHRKPTPAESAASVLPAVGPPPSTLLPLVASEIAAAPVAEIRSAAPPMTTAALAPATKPSDESAASPLPPPPVDAADPYQTRAVAVGLHPGLSRVLLARLSPADYRNAGTAIKKAVAETADTDVYIWPRQRKPELALFQVSFVPGAAPDCRRYVVKVSKDGWLTTALPMEKCGSKPGR